MIRQTDSSTQTLVAVCYPPNFCTRPRSWQLRPRWPAQSPWPTTRAAARRTTMRTPIGHFTVPMKGSWSNCPRGTTSTSYSCDTDDHGLLGAGLFRTTLGKDVVEYISDKIHNLPDELEQRKKASTKQQMSLERIRQKEKNPGWVSKPNSQLRTCRCAHTCTGSCKSKSVSAGVFCR